MDTLCQFATLQSSLSKNNPVYLGKKTIHRLQADIQSPDDADSSSGNFKLYRTGKYLLEPIMVSLWLDGQKLNAEELHC